MVKKYYTVYDTVEMSKIPKIVFIDWHNTLSNYKFFWNLHASDSKFDKISYYKLSDFLFVNNSTQLNKWLTGKYSTEEILTKASKACGLNFDYVFANFVKSCKSMKLISSRIPKIVNKMKKTGIKFYIATDNMDSFDRWTVPSLRLNELFDGIQNSFNLKVLKSDFDKSGNSLFFNDVLLAERVKPFETVIFDDHEDSNDKFKKSGFIYSQINDENKLVDKLLALLKIIS